MLKALILENFKAFGGRRVIPIRPITLIFGPNSAGKSAILQSLLMLKQTISDPDAGDVPIRLKGGLVDLGSFRELVHKHKTRLACEVTPIVSLGASASILPFLTASLNAVDESERVCGIGVRLAQDESLGRGRLTSLPIYLGSTDEAAVRVEMLTADRESRADQIAGERQPSTAWPVGNAGIRPHHHFWEALYREFVDKNAPQFEKMLDDPGAHNLANWYEEEGFRAGAFWPSSELIERELDYLATLTLATYQADLNEEAHRRPLSLRRLSLEEPLAGGQHVTDDPTPADRRRLREFLFYFGGDAQRSRMPSLADLALELSAELCRLIEGLIYIGPLRQYPERHYASSGVSVNNVGTNGQFAFELLLNEPSLEDRLNATLANFKIGYSLHTAPLIHEDRSASGVFSVRLVETRSGVSVSLRDVGFGVSQVLPVLVQSQLASENTVIIEQPELHLHPRLQAELGDVFIRSALERNNTFLIETHSEHLILRLMRRIRDTSRGTLPDGFPEVTPNKVSIIYVQPTEDGSGSTPIPIELDDEGELATAWPNGFFEEGFHERFA